MSPLCVAAGRKGAAFLVGLLADRLAVVSRNAPTNRLTSCDGCVESEIRTSIALKSVYDGIGTVNVSGT